MLITVIDQLAVRTEPLSLCSSLHKQFLINELVAKEENNPYNAWSCILVTVVEWICFPQLAEEGRLCGYFQQELVKTHTAGNTMHTQILSDVSGQSY
jgi:hypothetical protein